MVLTTVVAGLVFVLSKRGKAVKIFSSTGTGPAAKVFRSDNVNHAPSENPNQTNPDEVPAANIETAPQTEKAKAISKNVEDMLKKGQNYFQTDQYDKAVMQFSGVIKSGGNKRLALHNRGVALFKLNKKDAALRDFKYAAKLGHQKAKAIKYHTYTEIQYPKRKR